MLSARCPTSLMMMRQRLALVDGFLVGLSRVHQL